MAHEGLVCPLMLMPISALGTQHSALSTRPGYDPAPRMALLLYLPVAGLLLWLAQRYVAPPGRAAALVLVLLPFVFCGKALLTGGVYAPVDLPYLTEPLRQMREPLGVAPPQNGIISDLYAQMIPWRKAVQYALRHREWPLWNPFMLSGDVLAASAQPAAYSPFTLLACLLPIAQGLTFSAAITFFLAALGAYLLARELGCRESVALFAAAAWMYAKAVAFFVLWSVGASWALLPFILLATRRVVRQPSVRAAAFLMVALTVTLLAGHPESLVQMIVTGAIYGAFELIRRLVTTVPRAALKAMAKTPGRVLLYTLAAGAAALGLGAIYILPILDAAPETMEHAFRVGGWAMQSHGVALIETGARLLVDLFPWLHGVEWHLNGVKYLPPNSAAVGSLVLALAFYALARVRSTETWFWGGLALFGVLAGGAWTPVMDVLSRFPLLDITLNERFDYAAICAFVMLAALGLEHVLERSDLRALLWAMTAVLVVVAAGRVLILHDHLVTDVLGEWGTYARFGEVGCLAVAALIVIAKPPLRNLVPLLLVVLLAQRFLEDGDVYPTVPSFAAYPPIPIFRAIRRDQGPFRIVAHAHGFIPGTSALYELEDVRGYEALTFARYFETYRLWCVHQPVWFNRVDDLDKPFLDFLNVRYAISSPDVPTPAGWHVVAKQRGAQLLENGRVIDRAFIPRTIRLGMPEGDAMNEMADETDFRDRAWIQAPMHGYAWTNAGGTLRVARRDAGLKIDADMLGDNWVVVSEPAWKGWRVYIDERRVQWYYANEAFLGFYVPKGRHTIRVLFLPDSFIKGRAVSLATLAGLLVFGVIWKKRSRQTP